MGRPFPCLLWDRASEQNKRFGNAPLPHCPMGQSSSVAADPPQPRHDKAVHLFIELKELRGGQRWEERGRWNHALKEEVVTHLGKEKWSRPHLPTLSVPALMRLRKSLGHANVRSAHRAISRILPPHLAPYLAALTVPQRELCAKAHCTTCTLPFCARPSPAKGLRPRAHT